MKKILAILAIVGSLVIINFYRSYTSAIHFQKDSDSTQRVVLDIQKGATADQIASLLKEKGLIQSEWAFGFYLKQNNLGSKLQAGRIVVQENFDMKELIDALQSGKSTEISVTLLEGWSNQQIADTLEEKGLTTADEFMECLETCEFSEDLFPYGYQEGYLYPDTYFVDPNQYSNQAFISRLARTLQQKLTEEDWANIEASSHNFEEIMIMASIIEREEKTKANRPGVADVLWKRFDNGIGLGADATVLYALGRTSGGLTYQDLQTNSPYNTRRFAGLPPTPIANPSLSSIRAAISPESNDYWYYLHAPDGQIYYGRTLEEHNANKAKYL